MYWNFSLAGLASSHICSNDRIIDSGSSVFGFLGPSGTRASQ
jgi:hypothetical protein